MYGSSAFIIIGYAIPASFAALLIAFLPAAATTISFPLRGPSPPTLTRYRVPENHRLFVARYATGVK